MNTETTIVNKEDDLKDLDLYDEKRKLEVINKTVY